MHAQTVAHKSRSCQHMLMTVSLRAYPYNPKLLRLLCAISCIAISANWLAAAVDNSGTAEPVSVGKCWERQRCSTCIGSSKVSTAVYCCCSCAVGPRWQPAATCQDCLGLLDCISAQVLMQQASWLLMSATAHHMTTSSPCLSNLDR